MMTLSKLLSTKGSKPFTTPVKVKIGGIGKTSKYVTDKGDNKEITTVGFCDKTSAMKGVVYYQTKIIPYKEGSTVMLLNYVFKADPSPTIIITTKTKVMKTSDLEVPDEYWAKAALIANPPPAECLTLKKVKLSPIKSMVSLKGKVVSVSPSFYQTFHSYKYIYVFPYQNRGGFKMPEIYCWNCE